MPARSTPSPIHRRTSVADLLAQLDYWKLLRLAVFVGFCVLLLVLA